MPYRGRATLEVGIGGDRVHGDIDHLEHDSVSTLALVNHVILGAVNAIAQKRSVPKLRVGLS